MITYVIPVYNQENTIGASVYSALLCARSLRGKVIVCVNRCTDHTMEEVMRFRCPLVTVLEAREHLGAIANGYRGIAMATTRYVSWLSGDDILNEAGQSRIAAVAEENGDTLSVIYGEYCSIDMEDNVLGISSVYERWQNPSRRNMERNILRASIPNLNGAWIPTTMYKDSIEAVNKYMEESMATYAGDIPIWWNLSKVATFNYVPTVQVYYRVRRYSTPLEQEHEIQRWARASAAMLGFYRVVQREASSEGGHSGRILREVRTRTRHILLGVGRVPISDGEDVWSAAGGLKGIRSVGWLQHLSERHLRMFRVAGWVYQAILLFGGRVRQLRRRMRRVDRGACDGPGSEV